MQQLSYVYNQILSVLTYTQLARIMEQRRNYDLRRLLSGKDSTGDILNIVNRQNACTDFNYSTPYFIFHTYKSGYHDIPGPFF